MNALAVAGWALIVVTYGGETRMPITFATERACLEAKSLSLTGLTLAANARADAEYKAELEQEAARQKIKDAEWRAAHPPRKPTPAEVKKWGKYGTEWWCSCAHSVIAEDGLIYDWPETGSFEMYPSPGPDEVDEYVRGRRVRKRITEAKTAECVEQ